MQEESTKNSFSLILGDKSYQAKDEKELSLVFELLKGSGNTSSVLHWNIIMQLDEKLIGIIKTYEGLLSCMRHLNYKNCFLLLIKIGDILGQIIKTSDQLGNILAGIPEENNKQRLIKNLRRKGLINMIKDSRDLENLLKWVYGDTEKLILDLLGADFLKDVLRYPKDIYIIFHFTNAENKDYLTDMLGLDFILQKVKTLDDFFYMLKCLSNEKAGLFLKNYSKEYIVSIIGNDLMFSKGLNRLSEKKEKLLLNYLGLNYV